MAEIAKKIIFTGCVQGVGFRFTAFNIANRCQLIGYVRNSLDGTVEMIAQGNFEDIDDFLRRIKEAFADYIEETKIQDIPLNTDFDEFKITF